MFALKPLGVLHLFFVPTHLPLHARITSLLSLRARQGVAIQSVAWRGMPDRYGHRDPICRAAGIGRITDGDRIDPYDPRDPVGQCFAST